ncbi:hypothetical protein H0H92_011143 [Tricholoma furcatifolium]|nr:hypothetical protein H0H92_011143 [Tricholoma furcatifolium]
MPDIDIHDRGAGALPVPCYRPAPGDTKGLRRTRASIIGGLLIDNDEGRRWFKEKYDVELADHRYNGRDINVNLRIRRLLEEEGIDAYHICTAPRRFESVCGFLIITHIERGPFIREGPEAYEEVYDEVLKPVPGLKEEQVRADLLLKLGIRMSDPKALKCELSERQSVNVSLLEEKEVPMELISREYNSLRTMAFNILDTLTTLVWRSST